MEDLLKSIHARELSRKGTNWHRYWSFFMVMVVLYTLWCIPFRIAFFSPYEPLFIYGDLLCFAIYMIDLYITWKQEHIARIQHVDFISSVPFHLIMSKNFVDGLAGSQCLLLIQFLKVFRLVELIGKIETTRFINPTRFRLLHLVLTSFLIAHCVGCAWFVIGYVEGYGINEWTPSKEIRKEPILNQYLRAIYWGFINTSGVDQTSPVTGLETAFCLVILFVGVSLYATVIGNVGSLLSNLDSTAVCSIESLKVMI